MPRVVDHEARRAELLDRAFTLFAERGVDRVSMRALATEVGWSTGTLYHYFNDKESLFEALVRHRAQADLDEALAGLADDASPEVRLANITRFVARQTSRLQATLSVVIDFQRANPGSPFVPQVLDTYRQPLADALGPQLGSVALSLVLGLLVQRTLDPDAVVLADHLAALGSLSATAVPSR